MLPSICYFIVAAHGDWREIVGAGSRGNMSEGLDGPALEKQESLMTPSLVSEPGLPRSHPVPETPKA